MNNVGSKDRVVRLGLGAALLLYGLINGSWVWVLGLLFLLSGLLRICFLYKALGISTSKGSCCQCGDDGTCASEKQG